MAIVKSLNDLKQLKAEVKSKLELREKAEEAQNFIQVRVAMATCGIASGAKLIMEYLIEEFDKRNINAVVTQTGCMGYCYAEPTIEITLPGQEPVVFGYVDTSKANAIIEKFIKNGEYVEGIIPVNYKTIE